LNYRRLALVVKLAAGCLECLAMSLVKLSSKSLRLRMKGKIEAGMTRLQLRCAEVIGVIRRAIFERRLTRKAPVSVDYKKKAPYSDLKSNGIASDSLVIGGASSVDHDFECVHLRIYN
jgi:hypothetical protein